MAEIKKITSSLTGKVYKGKGTYKVIDLNEEEGTEKECPECQGTQTTDYGAVCERVTLFAPDCNCKVCPECKTHYVYYKFAKEYVKSD